MNYRNSAGLDIGAALLWALVLACSALWSAFASAQTPVPPIVTPQILNLAVVGPLTPSSKAFGIAHLQSITLAVDEYNLQNAASGREIQLKIFDDKATPAVSASAVKSLAKSDVLAILGPANSAATSAVIDLLRTQALRIPVISSLSTATKLTEGPETKYFFRANVSDRKRLSTMLELIFGDENHKPRRLIAFYERADAFGEGMLRDAKSWLHVNNASFLQNNVLEVDYPRDISQADAAALVADAYAKGFGAKNDAILLLGIAQDAITFVDVLRKKNVQARIYFNEPDHLVFKAAANRGVSVGGVHVLSVYWPDNATVNTFRSSFLKRFNEEPSFSAALAYDATRMVLRAIDVAFAEGPSPSENIQAFRDRVQANLLKDAGPPLDYVLGGDHRFEKDEYRKLDFQGLQYTSRGNLIQWNQNPDEPARLGTVGEEKPIILPPIYDLVFVVVFAFIGSTIREFSRRPPEDFWQLLGRLASPISLIVDPAISLIVFGCIFLLTILTRRSLLEIGGDALLIYNVASIALGTVSGFLGIRALYAVIKHMGINIQEQDLTGPVVREQAQQT